LLKLLLEEVRVGIAEDGAPTVTLVGRRVVDAPIVYPIPPTELGRKQLAPSLARPENVVPFTEIADLPPIPKEARTKQKPTRPNSDLKPAWESPPLRVPSRSPVRRTRAMIEAPAERWYGNYGKKVVEEVFRLKCAGKSLDEIAQTLTKKGHRRPGGGRWLRITISDIIRNIIWYWPDLDAETRAKLETPAKPGPRNPSPQGKVASTTRQLIVHLKEKDGLTFQAIADELIRRGILNASGGEYWDDRATEQIYKRAIGVRK
jgi:hypothetical protein